MIFVTSHSLRFFHHVAFAGGEEEVCFETVLAGVEVEVASAEGVEGFVGAAFDDVSAFDYEDLVSPADGREAVGDHEGRASLHEEAEPVLDHGFGF